MAPPLLAVAHGSRDPRAAATVHALVEEVRRHRPHVRVEISYLGHSPPTVGQALSSLDGGGGEGGADVVVLPLLLTAAYHSKTDIPRALADARSRHPRMRLRYGNTLGPHPTLVTGLERRLSETGVPVGDEDTAVVLTSAGSSDPGANATITEMAGRWRKRGWWAVTEAYASAASPTPAEAVNALRASGAPRVAVAPYFLAPGYFADKVREAALGAGADAVAPVLGPTPRTASHAAVSPAPEVAEVMLQRYDEALRARAEIREAG